jgi:hypothetical protein
MSIYCYSTNLDLCKIKSDDVFNINISDIEIRIKIDRILGTAVIVTFSLGNFKQQLIVSIKNVKLQVVIINNILYFLLKDKPIILSEINPTTLNIKSNLNFVPDECPITELLLSLDPNINIIPL